MIFMEKEHVKSFLLDNVDNCSLGLTLFSREEEREPPEVDPDLGKVWQHGAVTSLPRQCVISVDGNLKVGIVGGEHALI